MSKSDRKAAGIGCAVPAPWRHDVVFVCKKCEARRKADVTPAGDVRGWLKQRLKADGLRREVRVVTVGCFGLCPKRGVTTTSGALLADPQSALVVVDENSDLDEVYRRLTGRAA
jgi:predicted metal-binding protein